MSRGGRGFSPRGGSSYRGRGSDSGWNNNGSRARIGFSGPSRGRFNWFKDNASGFESRKFSGSNSGERFASRGRGEDSGYRRYSRPEQSYSSRDHSHHRSRSPDSSRKRLRTDSYGSQASSSRRSHEGSYSGSGDYNNRYNYEEKGRSYGEDRMRFREDSRSTGYRERSREDYSHRKPDQMMPPPMSSRHLSSPRPRGSYRGRVALRGVRGGMSRILQQRRNDSLIARRKFSETYAIRKQFLTTKVQSDAWRKLKLQKLRSRLATSKTADATDKVDEEASGDELDDDVENPNEELEEGETVDKKESTPVKVKKEKLNVEEREEGEEVDEDDVEKMDEQEGGVQITIKHDSDTRDVSGEGHTRRPIPGYRKHFIRLACPHCHYRCVTFKEYAMHLYSARHISVMRKVSLVHKQRLVSMRISQRKEQRLLEETEELEGGVLAPRTNFCHICKLNYRQLKPQHMASESHEAMRSFLLPFCQVCRVSYKSPMVYENHICSLEHIKRKSRLEEKVAKLTGNDNGSGSEADSDDKDIDKYMTLDSVGTVDAADGDVAEDGELSKESGEPTKKDRSKPEVNLGSEYLRKVEVYFCDLCKLYLPRTDQQERAIALHCTSRNHLQRYIRCRNDQALRKKAENIHQKESAEKKAEEKRASESTKTGEPAANGTEVTDSQHNEKNAPQAGKVAEGSNQLASTAKNAAESLQAADEKLWADVDKDLGDLLGQVLPEIKVSSDDEEEGDSGRYDRFGCSSKQVNDEQTSEVDSIIKLDEELPEKESGVVEKEITEAGTTVVTENTAQKVSVERIADVTID